MAKDLMIPYHVKILNPKFQMIWPKNKVARALPCLAWAPPNLAGRQHSATGFCFGPLAKLCLVQLISNFESKLLEYYGNDASIAIWIGENSEHPTLYTIHMSLSLEFFKLTNLLQCIHIMCISKKIGCAFTGATLKMGATVSSRQDPFPQILLHL